MSDQESNNADGAQPAATAPVESQAQADAPVTMSALKELLVSFKTDVVTEAKNGINADLRRSGVFKTAKADKQTEQPPPASGQPTGLSMADIEARFEERLERERVITARATKHELSDAVVRRMKAALSGVAADQFATEADAFLSDLGLVKTTPPAPTNTQSQSPVQPVTQHQPPISDKGSPSPGQFTPNWKLELGQNPIGMSAAARTAMDAELGVDKARRMRLEASREQTERIKVTRPRSN